MHYITLKTLEILHCIHFTPTCYNTNKRHYFLRSNLFFLFHETILLEKNYCAIMLGNVILISRIIREQIPPKQNKGVEEKI